MGDFFFEVSGAFFFSVRHTKMRDERADAQCNIRMKARIERGSEERGRERGRGERGKGGRKGERERRAAKTG